MLKKDAEDYKIESREKFHKQAEKYDSGNKGKHAQIPLRKCTEQIR